MKIELTELEPCKFTVHYEANFMEIGDKRAEVESNFKRAPVPGFRPNKASPEAIRVHYRQQIDDSLKRALAEDAFHNTLFEKKIKAHGPPRFQSLTLDGGKFVCEFEMHTKPDFELGQYKELEIPKPHEPMNAIEMGEAMMQDLRVRLGDVAPYADGDFVQNGDNILVDYEGSVDGVKVESLTATGEMMTIGKSPLPGFDDNLLGMAIGDTREFDFQAPEGGLPSVSGKQVHFKVTLNMGSKTVPCALGDEMAKKMGKNTFAELQEAVAQTAFARSANAAKMAKHEAISKKLVDSHTINVPNWMSLSEAQYLAQQSQLNWSTMPDPDKEKIIEVGAQNVKLALILDRIRENEPEAQLTDQEVFEIVKANLANTKAATNLDEVIQQMSRTGYLQILFSRIRDENTMDFIAKSVKVIE
jgi:trigger factor